MSTEQLWIAQLHRDGKGANACSVLCARTMSWCPQHVLCEYPVKAPQLLSSVKCCPVLYMFTCIDCFLFFQWLKKDQSLLIHSLEKTC